MTKKNEKVAEQESAPVEEPKKTIYNFDGETGEFISSRSARRDPEEKEVVFLIPANATDIEPPETGDGEKAVFDKESESWSVKKDQRGVYYKPSGEAVIISALGEEKGEDWTVERPVTWDSVRVERDRLLKDSDWTQLGDAPLSKSAKDAWADYRSQLRAITEQSAPGAVTWPEKPAA